MSKGWKIVKLGEEFDLQMGKTPDRKNDTYWNTGDNLWVSIADMSNCSSKYIVSTKETISDYATINMKQVPKGTVIMSFKLSIGKVSITDANLYTNEAIMAFLPRNDYYADFLYYRLLSFAWTEGLNKAVKGITLNKASISNTKILFPSFEQQKRIVATLDKASELIALRKKQLEELDALAESVFYDMFGDPVKNEKGWKIGKMINFSEITSSKRIFANEYTSEGIPFYRSKEIAELGAKLDISIELFISKDRFQDIKQEFGIPQKGDILIAAIGATIGKMWVVDTDEDFYFKDGNIIWIKNKGFVATFLRRVLFSMITTVKERLTNGGAYPALTIITLKDMDVILPPLSFQTRFATIIEKIEGQKVLVKKALQESEDLFQRLMQDLFKPD